MFGELKGTLTKSYVSVMFYIRKLWVGTNTNAVHYNVRMRVTKTTPSNT